MLKRRPVRPMSLTRQPRFISSPLGYIRIALPFVTINPSRHLQPNCRSRQLVVRDFRFWTDPFPPSNSLFSIFENTKEKMVKIATITRRRNENNKWRKRGDKAEREREIRGEKNAAGRRPTENEFGFTFGLAFVGRATVLLRTCTRIEPCIVAHV